MIAYRKSKAEDNNRYLYDFINCELGGTDDFGDDGNIGKFAIPRPIDFEETINDGDYNTKDDITEEVKDNIEKFFSSITMPNELTENYEYGENKEAIEDIDFAEAQLAQIIHNKNGEIKKVVFTF